ncbi:hypothetical protein PVK06_028114 [Gossypium arboreum]|uniref:MULE transposase domain-containing protein n=1 Tax=Gossypium arboreum TaxID=29729 RepID=A0ABR0P219_GOSAR|nr:hypothetical protein PVK06_028114 [Gossypium arboreum]
MNSYMLATFILPTEKADPRTLVPILIANIRSQLRYTPSYRKAWIAKQKALEKIHGGGTFHIMKCGSGVRYTHRLLLVVTQDDSGRIFPIVLAITPGESADNWEFFLSRLMRHVCLQPNICVISDKGTGILAAIERQGNLWHCTHHRYCLRHWTQAYDDGLRYGHMTSNLAECINFFLKGTRYLPITLVVRETYFSLAALFSKRAASYKGQMQEGRVWCAKVLQEINKAKAQANIMHTVCHDRDNLWFRVTEFDRLYEGIIGGQYYVHLINKTYDCGRFDALRYTCAHVIAACQNLLLDPMSYDEVYKLETM